MKESLRNVRSGLLLGIQWLSAAIGVLGVGIAFLKVILSPKLQSAFFIDQIDTTQSFIGGGISLLFWVFSYEISFMQKTLPIAIADVLGPRIHQDFAPDISKQFGKVLHQEISPQISAHLVEKLHPFFSLVSDQSHRSLTTFCNDLLEISGGIAQAISKGKIEINKKRNSICEELLFYSLVEEILDHYTREKKILEIKMMHVVPELGIYPTLIRRLQKYTQRDELREKFKKLYVFRHEMQYDPRDFRLKDEEMREEAARWSRQLEFSTLLVEDNSYSSPQQIRLLYKSGRFEDLGVDGSVPVFNDPQTGPKSLRDMYDGIYTTEFIAIKTQERNEDVKTAAFRDKADLSFKSGVIYLRCNSNEGWIEDKYFDILFGPDK